MAPADAGVDRAAQSESNRPLRIAGVLFSVAGAAILMGIITGEALFPVPYDTADNTISDLGSTWQPGGIVREPSATIFNATMIVSGLLISAGAVFLRKGMGKRAVVIAIAVLGLSILAVGIFHGEEINGEPSSSGVHPIVAMLAFVSGGVAAILSSRVTEAPFRQLSVLFGSIAILSLVLSGPLGDTNLGMGGIERWVAYPVVLWLVAFGGYLMASDARVRT